MVATYQKPANVEKREKELLEAALKLAQLGLPVHPLYPLVKNSEGNLICTCQEGAKCNKPGKHPWTNWRTTEKSTTDEETIRRWWSKQPLSGIGINTENLLVLDSDGPDGDASLQGKQLPPAPKVRTGHGYHRYYKRPEGLQIQTNGVGGNKVRFLPGLDIRTDGGQVVAPPTLHQSGVTYQWELAPDQTPLADPPGWLLDELKKEKPKPASDTAPKKNSQRFKGYVQKALENEVEKVRQAPDGERNNTLNQAAFNMGTLVAATGYDPGIERELEAAATFAGLERSEIKQTIRSGFEAGKKNPRKIEDGDKEPVIDWADWHGAAPEGIGAYPRPQPGKAQRSSTARNLSSDKLLEKDLPPPSFLVDGLVSDVGTAILAGGAGYW
jgi:hypothetical protein